MEFTLDNGAFDSDEFAVGNPTDCGIYFGCMDPSADNYDAINTIDDGSCDYSCPDATQVSITVDGGSWQAEATEIVDANGEILVSRGIHTLMTGFVYLMVV